MNLSLSIGLVAFLMPTIAQASVTAVWSPADAAAASAWLNGIGDSASRQDPDSFLYFTTDDTLALSAPIIANLTVWSDHAELNILGIGSLPAQLQLWGGFPIPGTILEIWPSQLVVASPEGGANYFSHTSSFAVEPSFSRVAFNSAAVDGLLLIADSGGPASDFYTFRLATVPEPAVAALGAVGFMLLLHRRRNRKGEQAVPSDGHKPSNSIPTTGTTAPADAH
jgi:hypothetical protein